MKQFLRSGFLLTAACVASSLSRAQTILYSTDFPDDQGWTLTSSTPPVVWAVDDTPAKVSGANSWLSAPFSLNFNNGVNYHPLGMGTATSPPIDLSVANGSVRLVFWCNWLVESPNCCGCGWDERKLFISNNGFQTLLHTTCYLNDCGPSGQWHAHQVTLDKAWGTIQLQFYFNTLDSSWNGYAGWFIDDLEVSEVTAGCADSSHYCYPKLNSIGCTPQIFTAGQPSLSGTGTAFRIVANNFMNQKIGLMNWGTTPWQAGFGGGTLCVSQPIHTAPQDSGGSSLPAADCTGTYALQFTPAMMTQAGLVVSQDVYCQYWSRDPGFTPPFNISLTAGVHWQVCP